jgi:hypothetical protein
LAPGLLQLIRCRYGFHRDGCRCRYCQITAPSGLDQPDAGAFVRRQSWANAAPCAITQMRELRSCLGELPGGVARGSCLGELSDPGGDFIASGRISSGRGPPFDNRPGLTARSAYRGAGDQAANNDALRRSNCRRRGWPSGRLSASRFRTVSPRHVCRLARAVSFAAW